MKVADDRNVDSHVREAACDLGNCTSCFVIVDSYSNQLAAGAGELGDLERCCDCIGSIRIGHRLDDDRMCRADCYVADECCWSLSAGDAGQLCLFVVKMKANSLARPLQKGQQFPSSLPLRSNRSSNG